MSDTALLLQTGENETIEFKERWTSSCLETLGSFANTHGGTLLVGVTDEKAIVGVSGTDIELQTTTNQIVDSLRIHPVITVEEIQGKKILSIKVSESGTPVAYHGRYFQRIGNTTREIPPTELGHFFVSKIGAHWDSVTDENYTLEDINSDTLKNFIKIAQSYRLPHISGDEDDLHILEKLELVKQGKLTHAAILLFGKQPHSYFLSAQVHMGRFKDDITITDDKLITGNLFEQVEQIIQLFHQYLKVRFEMPHAFQEGEAVESVQRQEIWEYPLESLREAVINALIHRDYLSSADIQIRVYDNKITIRGQHI